MSARKSSKRDTRSQVKDTMSSGTKELIQKFCFKKTAAVDMTKNGFIYDNKLFALSLLLRALRDKCQQIWGTTSEVIECKKKKHSAKGRRRQELDKKIPRTPIVKEYQKRVLTFKKEVKINVI